MTDFAHSPYASEARVRKAIRLEAVLRMAGADADTARALDDKGRRDAEKAAGVRKSSDETWGVVFTLMDSGRAPIDVSGGAFVEVIDDGRRTHPTCPADGLEQGDPALCHHCDNVIAWPPAVIDARAPAIRFCSEICSNRHLAGMPPSAPPQRMETK